MSETQIESESALQPEQAAPPHLPAPSRFRSPWAICIYLLVAWILFSRLWNLGLKPVQHDESMFAYYSWLPYEKMPEGMLSFDLKKWDAVRAAYEYNPLLHGPVLEWVTAAMFRIFGDNDYSMRLFPALCGVAIFWILFLLRGDIGERATYLAMFFLAISPSMTYVTRYIRPDLLIFLTYMLILHAGWRYSQKLSGLWLTWLVFLCWFASCVHETYVIFYFLISTFGLGCWIHGFVKQKRYLEIAMWFVWLIVLGGISFWVVKSFSIYSAWKLAIPYGVFIAATIPLAWWIVNYGKKKGLAPIPFYREMLDAFTRRWWGLLLGNAVGLGISIMLMTSFFYGNFWKHKWGQYEAWVYWSGQHAEHRIRGAFHYHLPILLWYELPFFTFYVISLMKEFWPTHRDSGLRLRRILVLAWAALSLLLLLLPAWWTKDAGDQFWNVQLPLAWDKKYHISMGFHIWMFFQVLLVVMVIGWKHLNQGRYFLAFVDYWACGSLLAYSYAGEKVPWVTTHIVLPMLISCGIYANDVWKRWFDRDASDRVPISFRPVPRFALIGVSVVGLAWTFWVGILACFIQSGSPIERMSYASSHAQFHAATRFILREIKEKYQGYETPIAFGGQVSWPLHWILRNFKNTQVFSVDMERKTWSPNDPILTVTMRTPPGPAQEAQFVVIDSDMMEAWSPRPKFKDRYEWGRTRFRHYWQPEPLKWRNMMQFLLLMRADKNLNKDQLVIKKSGIKDWKKLIVAYFHRDEELSRDKAPFEWYTMGGFDAFYGRLLEEAPTTAE